MEITKHAMTRYAERIAGREEKIDVSIYIAQNEAKITEDLNKMFEYSRKIYTGQIGKDKSPVIARLTGTWVLLMDPSDERLITLYKIDFGVGEDFNKTFIERCLEKLKCDIETLEERERTAKEEVQVYMETIKSNEKLICEYKTMIKNLETTNAAYKDIVAHKADEYSDCTRAVREDIENLIQRKEW